LLERLLSHLDSGERISVSSFTRVQLALKFVQLGVKLAQIEEELAHLEILFEF
jgi:hypothetical protein